MEQLQPGAGFADVELGARSAAGGVEGFARGEAGWHFAPTGSAFAFAEGTLAADTGAAWQAGLGARFTW